MTRTLDLVRAAAEKAARQAQDLERRQEEDLQRQASAAQPLLTAFRDLEGEYVRIDVLRHLWPTDYEHRDDRLRGLLAGYVAHLGHCYGLELHIPGGLMRFTAELSPEGEPRYWATKEVGGLRPMAMDFTDRDDWLGFFYRTVAFLIDLPDKPGDT